MSVLIKGMEMPMGCYECPFEVWGKCMFIHYNAGGAELSKDCPLVELPTPHGRLIDARALYERTAEWEAQALAQVEKLDPRIENQRRGWVHWSAVLTERSAFKHDLMDAPTIIEAEEDVGVNE